MAEFRLLISGLYPSSKYDTEKVLSYVFNVKNLHYVFDSENIYQLNKLPSRPGKKGMFLTEKIAYKSDAYESLIKESLCIVHECEYYVLIDRERKIKTLDEILTNDELVEKFDINIAIDKKVPFTCKKVPECDYELNGFVIHKKNDMIYISEYKKPKTKKKIKDTDSIAESVTEELTKCEATKKDGKQCTRNAKLGEKYCGIHLKKCKGRLDV